MKQVCSYIITPLIMSYGLIHCASRLPLNIKKHLCKQAYSQAHVPHKKGEPLRILFVVESFPHFDQPFILDQIVGTIDRGHDVYIAAKTSVKNNRVSDVIYRHNLKERTLFFGKSNPLKLLQNHSKMPHINTFDVVCCQFGNIGANIIKFEREVGGIAAKVVTCWRGALKEAKMKKYEYVALFAQGNLFLPVCEFLKKRLMKFGCHPSKIQVVHSGIHYDSYVCNREIKTRRNINLMSNCRLVEKKGIEYAIRAVASVAKIYPDIHYTIVGDGPLKEHLESVVMQLNMQSYIEFIGNQPHDKIPELLRNVDIFLSPSVTAADGNHEGIANSLKEAMASGVLVIGTDHAGTIELIEDGVSGFLVPEGDIDALAEKIQLLILSPEVWDDVRLFGQKAVRERFCLSKTIDQFVAIIEEVCIH